MTKFIVATTTLGALAVAALGLAGPATATPTGGSSASDAVMSLQADGYTVQFNGTVRGPLSRCTVTGVHGLAEPMSVMDMLDPTHFDTVYLDLSCPSTNN